MSIDRHELINIRNAFPYLGVKDMKGVGNIEGFTYKFKIYMRFIFSFKYLVFKCLRMVSTTETCSLYWQI